MTLITPNNMTPVWLTEQLVQGGHLAHGHVQSLDLGQPAQTDSASQAILTPIKVTYVPGPSPAACTHPAESASAPVNLMYKLCQGDLYWLANIEAILYNDIAPQMDDPAVPRCVYTASDPEHQLGGILLEDISVSHERLPWPLPRNRPNRVELEKSLDELLKFHIHWWQHPYVDQKLADEQGGPLVLGHVAKPEVIRRYCDNLTATYPNIVAGFGDQIPLAWRKLCEQVIAVWPDLLTQRLNSGQGLTMIHGDFHLWNIYFPLKSQIAAYETERPLFLDWETFRRGLGVYDLAYLLISSDDVDFRRQWEQDLLKYYHAGLLAGGIEGYSWADCQHDYRLSVIANLGAPLMWARFDSLESSIRAFEDWDCADLLVV